MRSDKQKEGERGMGFGAWVGGREEAREGKPVQYVWFVRGWRKKSCLAPSLLFVYTLAGVYR